MSEVTEKFNEILEKESGNIISKSDVSAIKIKLGKSHRKESDWDFIKGILYSSDLVTLEIKQPAYGMKNVDHLLLQDNTFCVFTNIEDCVEYMKNINKIYLTSSSFIVGVMPFSDVVELSKLHGYPVAIDVTNEKNKKFMLYNPRTNQITASILASF